MKDKFRAAKFFLDKVKKLYPTFQYPDEIDVDLWTEILEGHSQTDILEALKSYRRETEYNKAPTPAEFRKFLEAIKSNDRANMRQRIEKCAAEIEEKFGVKARNRYIRGLIDAYGVELKPETEEKKKSEIPNPAVMFMQRDIALGKCRHLLPMYQRAVNYILTDLLSREMPVSQWKDLDFAERVEQAAKKGLFDRLDEVLVMVCRQRYGKDYQFDSANMLTAAGRNNSAVYSGAGAVKGLAAHYSANTGEDSSDTLGF